MNVHIWKDDMISVSFRGRKRERFERKIERWVLFQGTRLMKPRDNPTS